MAVLAIDDVRLRVQLSRMEKLGALRGDLDVPVGAVRDVRAHPTPFAELRGIRAPGIGLPGVIALGTWRRRGAPDFAALYRGRPGVVVELAEGPYGRLLVSVDDPDAVAERLLQVIRSPS